MMYKCKCENAASFTHTIIGLCLALAFCNFFFFFFASRLHTTDKDAFYLNIYIN